MQLEAAFVRLRHRELERIVVRLGRTAHLSCQIFRPGLELRRIERIGGGPDLENHRIHVQRHRLVEDGDQLGLLLPCIESGPGRPVDVCDRRDPDGAKLAGDLRRLRNLRPCRKDRRQTQNKGKKFFFYLRELIA